MAVPTTTTNPHNKSHADPIEIANGIIDKLAII
jgi:hypothetical protein